MPTPAASAAPAVPASRTPVATSPPSSRAKSTSLAREYAARLRALLAAVDTVEEAALAAIMDGLRALRDALVRAATGGGGGGRGAATAAPTPGPGAASGAPSGPPLDPSTVIAQIDAAIRDFQARMTGTLFAAQSEALAAGALTIDGILKPAVVLARDRAAAAKATSASRALVPARGDRFGVGGGGGSLGGLGFGAPGAGGGRNRLPPIQITPPGGGGGGFGGGSVGGFSGGGNGGPSPGLPHLSIVGAFPVIPDKLRSAVAALAAEEVTTLTTNLRQGMASAIRRAALGGLTPFEVMREVDKALPATTRGAILAKGIGSSAERIVRTQMSRVFAKSADARAKALAEELRAAGLDKGAWGLKKQWLATMDSRTRASHLAAHGQTVGVGEDFVVDGERLAFPGDPSGSAGNVIQCRCRMVTVLPDNPADLFAR